MKDHSLFNRIWSVAIGESGKKGREWKDLKIEFRIEKTSSNPPNKLELKIINLSAESRQAIEKKNLSVVLTAGYLEDTRMLFVGSLDKVSHSHNGLEWETKIEASDGGKNYRSTMLHESFGPGTTESQVVRHIAAKLGLVVGELQGLSEEKFAQGRQLVGPAHRELDLLCKTRGLRWSIQDETLQILKAGSALKAIAVRLTPATGLIGSPEKTESGIKIVSLLQGGLNPGRLIQLESESLKGLYVAKKVTHHGDSHGTDWYTEIEARPQKGGS